MFHTHNKEQRSTTYTAVHVASLRASALANMVW